MNISKEAIEIAARGIARAIDRPLSEREPFYEMLAKGALTAALPHLSATIRAEERARCIAFVADWAIEPGTEKDLPLHIAAAMRERL